MQLTAFEWVIIGAAASLALGVIGFFLKRTMNRTDRHDEDINIIKQTYVSHSQLKEFKDEMKGETKKLARDVEEIKANYLTKSDFIQQQAKTERQLDRVLEILIDMKGGSPDGR